LDSPLPTQKPVLILGAGINGVAVARDLLLNGVPVCVVEKHDVAYGATSRSSRLIHGGVRYLEYGEFRLVSESLTERALLLRLAPQYVKPLTLFIPVRSRFGGLLYSVFRFLSAYRIPFVGRLANKLSKHSERGVWLLRSGLTLYDWLARRSESPKHTAMSLPSAEAPAIDSGRYRWACQYMDAQIQYAERFVVAMLHDCERLAAEKSVSFQLFTHATAQIAGREANIVNGSGAAVSSIQPSLVINATGAWGDKTLSAANVKARRMFGGTKGSHLFSHKRQLRDAIGQSGIYAEASDGRLVFILPFGDAVMVGTTDVRFENDPGDAIASNDEIEYLIGMVNTVLPSAALSREDVDLHYSGVRPLPYHRSDSTAVVSRDHSIKEHTDRGMTWLTLIGGKLTTCRAFAQLATDQVLSRLGMQRLQTTAELPYFGAAGCPQCQSETDDAIGDVATQTGFTVEQVRSVWRLCGAESMSILNADDGNHESLPGTNIPVTFAKWVIQNEWTTSLEDLVERRLMLVYEHDLSRSCLETLVGLIPGADATATVDAVINRLEKHYGRSVT
jgi:glycerol-3-phosphate dehydrogenase